MILYDAKYCVKCLRCNLHFSQLFLPTTVSIWSIPPQLRTSFVFSKTTFWDTQTQTRSLERILLQCRTLSVTCDWTYFSCRFYIYSCHTMQQLTVMCIYIHCVISTMLIIYQEHVTSLLRSWYFPPEHYFCRTWFITLFPSFYSLGTGLLLNFHICMVWQFSWNTNCQRFLPLCVVVLVL